jgi:hypothetical protein
MWTKLNETMLKHKFPKPNFKGSMVNNTKANWNVIKIVYGCWDVSIKMVDRECTCVFHWGHSFDKHPKQLIILDLQHEHKAFYY